MKRFEEFNTYEKSIVENLIALFDYSEKEAIFVVGGYGSIVEKVGFFDNPMDWAEKLDTAMEYHITPDMWHNVL